MVVTPQQFIERVVAWPGPDGPGYVNLHWTKDTKWRGRPFRSVDEFMSMAQWLAPKATVADDIYFCTTTQLRAGKVVRGQQTASRSAPNAIAAKALWLDIDIKSPPKGYASIEEALDAVIEFCKTANIPGPTALVASGGGLHVYWISDRPLTIEEWEPYARGLQAEAKRLELRCDPITADAARVLRVPGTFNRKRKDPRPVVVKALAEDDLDFTQLERLAEIGRALIKPVTAAVIAGAKPCPFDLTPFSGYKPPEVMATLDPLADNLADGIVGHSDLPLKIDNVFRQCVHFQTSFTQGGKGQSQGLWHLTVLASTWFEDGREIAHLLSKDYPGYTPEETDKMYDRKVKERAEHGLGWPSCKSFENEGADCVSCPMRGMIRSPLNMADRAKLPGEYAAPSLPVSIKTADMNLPDGYVINNKGIVCRLVDYEVNGEARHDLAELFHGPIIGVPWLSTGRDPGLNFTYDAGTFKYEVFVPDRLMGVDITLLKCLSEQSVRVQTSNEKYVRDFIVSWSAKIESAIRRQNSAPFGWVHEDGEAIGFAYGGKLFRSDGTIEAAAVPDHHMKPVYTPQGSPAVLDKLWDILSAQNHPALEVIALQAFAAPLLFVTGEDSVIIWAWSSGAGARKSTSHLTGSAVWASPRRAKENPTMSIMGLQTKLGQLVNLPVYVDEIQHTEEVEKLRPQIHHITEGTSGAKSTRQRTAAVTREWQTIVCCCANRSIYDLMVRGRTPTNADLVRVFEVPVEKRDLLTHSGNEVRSLTSDLNYNYGHVGQKFAHYMATHRADLKTRGREIDAEVEQRIAPYRVEERFWKAAVVTTILGAEVANEIIGRPIFHIEELWEFMLDTYRCNRSFEKKNIQVGGTPEEAESVLAGFLQDHMNNQLWTQNMTTGRGRPTGQIKLLRMPPKNTGKGNPVHVHWCVDARVVRISRVHLGRYITEEAKLGLVSTIDNIVKRFGGRIRDKVNLTAGCENEQVFPGPRETVIEIDIPVGSPLEENLMAFTKGDMSVVGDPLGNGNSQ